MKIFEKLMSIVANNVPEWVALLLLPATVLALAVLFTVVGSRRAYAPLSTAIGSAGFFIVLCYKWERSSNIPYGIYVSLAYAALFAVFAVLLSLLFLIPCPLKGNKKSRAEKEKARDEAIYAKFHEDLEPPRVAEEEAEPEVMATAEECGTCLSHVTTLLVKLQKEKLSPADRLETDALTRTVEGYRGKTLTAQELKMLNDCLASVLKMTAKYKL